MWLEIKFTGCWRSYRGLVINVLDCDIVVSEFELQSRNHVHFRTCSFGKGMNPLIPSTVG